jgi:hypothetical protein
MPSILAQFALLTLHLEVSWVYIAVSKKSPLLARIDDISQALRSMVDEGEIQQIMSEYGVVQQR